MWRIVLAIAFVSTLVAGCNRNADEEDKYTVDMLTFGTYYTNCDSACITMYEVTPSTVCRDDSATLADMTAWKYKFTNVRLLDVNRQAIAKPLLSQVPHELFANSTTVLGDPGPEGGMYLRIQTIPGIYLFKIDLRNSADQSQAVVAFKKQVLDVMTRIK
ncbi:MAG: hypothetical protein KF744_06415 [Taibaiella sp.]|nr:hypothetical protein [Taibaiella sp.]